MLPPRIKTQLKTLAHESNQRRTAGQRANITLANSLLRFVGVKQADEIGPAESRAIDKILMLP